MIIIRQSEDHFFSHQSQECLAKRESDLLIKRIITDRLRNHEFLLPISFEKIISTFSRDVRKEKRKPIQEQARSVLLRWHDACPFNRPSKANHIRQISYSYDYKSNIMGDKLLLNSGAKFQR